MEYHVALLAEGVDRNLRLWMHGTMQTSVALLAEGVDRNTIILTKERKCKRRPPRGGRG